MLRIIFTFLVILASPLAWTVELESNLHCTGGVEHNRPFMRVALSPFGFQNQIEKVLNAEIPHIESSVKELRLLDQSIGQDRGPCPRYRDKPGMDGEFLCMYLPKVLVGESIRLRHFKEDLKASIGFRMNFDQVIIPNFKLENPKVNCHFKLDEATCDIQVDVPSFDIQSHFALVDPREDKITVSTVSPIKLSVKAKDDLMPQIQLKATIASGGRANDAVNIVKDSIKFVVPPGTLSSDIQNNEGDVVSKAVYIFEKEVDQNLTEEERIKAVLALMESPRGHEIFQNLVISYSLIKIAKDFLGETDLLAIYQQPLLEHVEEPLSLVLSNVIDSALPFNDNVGLEFPRLPEQDARDGLRYIEKFDNISKYLDSVDEHLKLIAVNKSGKRYARDLRRSHGIELKKITRFVKNLRGSHIKALSDELDFLSVRLGSHKNKWIDLDLISSGLEKGMDETISWSKKVSDHIADKEFPAYLKSLLHIESVGHVDSTGVQFLVSGCHIGGITPDVKKGWHEFEMNKPYLNGNDFSIEVPLTVFNQITDLLYKNGFYDYCVNKDSAKSCAEAHRNDQTVFKLKKVPLIKKHKGKYIFEIPELERTSHSPLPNFLDRAFLQDSSRIRVCMDNIIVDPLTGLLIPKGCIDADANIGKLFRFELIFSLLNPISALTVLGIKATHATAQDQVLKNMEDGEISDTLNDVLMNNDAYNVRELRVEGERFSIFGKVGTK